MITNLAVLAAVRTAPCGFTSVAAYLAAGKTVTKCRPSLRGMNRGTHVRVAVGGRNRTGQILRAAVAPRGVSRSSIASIADAQRPYNGSAMKMFGPNQ